MILTLSCRSLARSLFPIRPPSALLCLNLPAAASYLISHHLSSSHITSWYLFSLVVVLSSSHSTSSPHSFPFDSTSIDVGSFLFQIHGRVLCVVCAFCRVLLISFVFIQSSVSAVVVSVRISLFFGRKTTLFLFQRVETRCQLSADRRASINMKRSILFSK